MKNRSMFPYRRGNGKKKPRNNNRRGREAGSKRLPNSPHEMLSVMQPATKALAQVLVGNTRPSGQLVHARNVLEHADQMVEARMIDRLPPQVRENFLEQLARLKLTIADAAEIEDEAEGETEGELEVAEAREEVDPGRLREVALKLAGLGGGASTGLNDSAKSTSEADSDSADNVQTVVVEDNRDDEPPAKTKVLRSQDGVRSSKLRLNVPKDDRRTTTADA